MLPEVDQGSERVGAEYPDTVGGTIKFEACASEKRRAKLGQMLRQVLPKQLDGSRLATWVAQRGSM